MEAQIARKTSLTIDVNKSSTDNTDGFAKRLGRRRTNTLTLVIEKQIINNSSGAKLNPNSAVTVRRASDVTSPSKSAQFSAMDDNPPPLSLSSINSFEDNGAKNIYAKKIQIIEPPLVSILKTPNTPSTKNPDAKVSFYNIPPSQADNPVKRSYFGKKKRTLSISALTRSPNPTTILSAIKSHDRNMIRAIFLKRGVDPVDLEADINYDKTSCGKFYMNSPPPPVSPNTGPLSACTFMYSHNYLSRGISESDYDIADSDVELELKSTYAKVVKNGSYTNRLDKTFFKKINSTPPRIINIQTINANTNASEIKSIGATGTRHKKEHYRGHHPPIYDVSSPKSPLITLMRKASGYMGIRRLIGNLYKNQYSPLSESDLINPTAIGQGVSGTVEKVYHVDMGVMIARKVIPLNGSTANLYQINEELRVLQTIRSKYVVKYYGAYISSEDQLVIGMEYLELGSLEGIMKKGVMIPENIASIFIKQLILCLEELLSRYKLLHRDIKPSNILLSNKGRVKLCDFGSSKSLDETASHANTFVGTSMYMSPERLVGQPYSTKSDVWSIGLILLELVQAGNLSQTTIHKKKDDAIATFDNPKVNATAAILPPPLESSVKLTRQKNNSIVSYDHEAYSFFDLLEVAVNGPQPILHNITAYTDLMKEFISFCLKKDPSQRPSLKELLKHPFILHTDHDGKQTQDWIAHLPPNVHKKE